MRGWYLSPEEVAERADLVTRVTVREVRPILWRDMVWTEAVCTIDETWRGAPPAATIRVRQTGGTLGDRMTEAGPRSDFHGGDQWLLAIDPIPESDAWTTIGLTQGAFRIENGMARRDYHGFLFIRPPPDEIRGNGMEQIPLADLKKRLAPQHMPAPPPVASPTSNGRRHGQRSTEGPGTSAAKPPAPALGIADATGVTTSPELAPAPPTTAPAPQVRKPAAAGRTNRAGRTLLIAALLAAGLVITAGLVRRRRQP